MGERMRKEGENMERDRNEELSIGKAKPSKELIVSSYTMNILRTPRQTEEIRPQPTESLRLREVVHIYLLLFLMSYGKHKLFLTKLLNKQLTKIHH